MAILIYLSIVFQIWMIIDAIRRRVEPFWYIVLLLPAGALVYFFFVKLRITELLNIAPKQVLSSLESTERDENSTVNLERLQNAVDKSPSFANRIRLAKNLYQAERFEEAVIYYNQALTTHPKDKEALYGLGLSYLELKNLPSAVGVLSKLIDESLRYDDYRAARILVQTLWQTGQRHEALLLLEEIVEKSTELRHRVALAHYLIESNRIDEAIELLEKALESFERASDYIQRNEMKWASEAREMVQKLADH